MFLNTFLAFGSLFILTISIALFFLHKTKHSFLNTIDLRFYSTSILFLSLSATVLPLVYQYYFLYPPCMLCWYQRIFMFPIFIASVYGVLYKKFNDLYSLFIIYASIGLLFSVYHWMIQMNITSEGALCTTASNTVACTTVEILEFGFITMPFMAGCAFITLLTLAYIAKNRTK